MPKEASKGSGRVKEKRKASTETAPKRTPAGGTTERTEAADSARDSLPTAREESKSGASVSYNGKADMPLAEFVAKSVEGGAKMMLDEYKDLKKMQFKGLTSEAFKRNPLKNRYQDVACWDQSRVVLGGTPGKSTNAAPANDYIHANFVDGALKPRQFIATQGPIEDVPGQFDCTIPDFWTMVWEQKVSVIIMLCQTVEGGKAKCAQYWPDKTGARVEWGNVQIEAKDYAERNIEDHKIYITTLELLKDGFTNTRQVVHFLHANWPDRKCPPSAYPIVEFIIRCHASQKKACETNEVPPEESPMIVHCSAGIGRSGTFLAIDIALNLINKFNSLSIKEIVRVLRMQRNFAVQTPIQYVCIYQAVLEYAAKHKAVKFDAAKFAKEVARIKQ